MRSQQRAAAAQAAGKFKDEIVPMTTVMGRRRRRPAAASLTREVTIERTKASAPTRPTKAVAKIRPALPGGVITAGNASQFSDGSGACVVMDAKLAEQRGLEPLGIFRGFAVAGLRAGRDGHRPGVRRAERLLKRLGYPVKDIDLWELNEAFACR